MIRWLLAVTLAGIGASVAPAGDGIAVQTDWSGGGGVAGPVDLWAGSFDSSQDLAWLPWPGRLVIAASPRTDPVEHPLPGECPGAIKVVSADIDLDGDTDLLGVSYWGDRIDLLLNDGGHPPGWRRQTIVDGYSRALAVAVADIDGDGLPDIIGGADADGEISWWRNLGGDPPAWARYLVDDEVPGAHDVAAADLDLDRDLDIVGVSYEDDLVLWWRNEGGIPVTWSRGAIAAGFDYPTKVAVADVDGDGDDDVVAVAWLDSQLAWWRNDGGEPVVWSRMEVASGFAGAHWVAAEDIDRDGRVDILGAAMDLRQVAWWRNEGGEPVAWTKVLITGSLAGAVSVTASDLDGDGDLDVAASGWHSSGGVAWWENVDGAGGSWQRRPVATDFGESSSVAIADVDNDGAPDLLGSSWSLDKLAWWEVTELKQRGTLTASILDTGGTAGWTDCGWHAERPAGTDVVVEVRNGASPHGMGPWEELPPSGPCRVLVDGSRYLQYRVLLERSGAESSPSFEEVFFEWLPPTLPAPRRASSRLVP